jgi:hypothetical protein
MTRSVVRLFAAALQGRSMLQAALIHALSVYGLFEPK